MPDKCIKSPSCPKPSGGKNFNLTLNQKGVTNANSHRSARINTSGMKPNQ